MPKRVPLPTRDRLRELFDYDHATGVLRAKVGRRSRRGAYKAGDVIGYPDVAGYLKATVDGYPYAVHRIAWKWMVGEEPPEYIDHINRVKHDNSWANLRAADKYENAANVATRKPRGAKGVRPGTTAGTWTAQLVHRGQSFYLGTFTDEAEAVAAYRQKAKELRGAFGEEGPYVPAAIDVIHLIDEPFLDAVLTAVGTLRADPARAVSVAASLAVHMARVAPERYGFMAPR